MYINYFCPRWGNDGISWDEFLTTAKQVGYDGVEIGIPEDEKELDELLEKLGKYNLKFIAQHWETNHRNFLSHRKSFKYHIERIAKAKPFQLNSHTGKDYFTPQQNSELLYIANEISDKSNVTITHETHRGRFSFATHVIAQYINAFTNLKITLDISHWICVAESLLVDQQDLIEICVPHINHIHARIGHTQGSQVDDPRLKKWEETVKRHYEIWDEVVHHHNAAGTKELSFTTEFGPLPYMQVVPEKKNVTEFQMELNLHMLQELKERYRIC